MVQAAIWGTFGLWKLIFRLFFDAGRFKELAASFLYPFGAYFGRYRINIRTCSLYQKPCRLTIIALLKIDFKGYP